MTDPVPFKAKGDYSEHVIVKKIDGEAQEFVNIDAMSEDQWQKYCRDTGIEPFTRTQFIVR